MPRRLVLTVLIALLGLAALPAGASAGWFPAAANPPIDGPSPDIDKLGGVDLARDGTGGLVYLKRVDGTSHVFLSRFNGGAFRPPERVDNGILAGASDAVDRGRRRRPAGDRVDGGQHRLREHGHRQRPAAGAAARPDGALQRDGAGRGPSVDMGINGTAYASYTTPGGGGGDVHVSRLMDTTWSAVEPPLDISRACAAGIGNQRSKVGVSAEGNGIVTWGEGTRSTRAA